ncbi:hypothetical protein RHGRI_004846 [Rhododendron griersonianum]|uniref:Uncharacterized protein n=1 Tax=Rhododendron griersonianum TaxID=479676 RepID=A0AAV6KNC7_9ERIC|nr:hypothetical protein RHGRI_011760 [Rhododendron griersonianum]KAG5561940.1 hypothetical protein RHGRI_004846 [Rhododendron griersonianum]
MHTIYSGQIYSALAMLDTCNSIFLYSTLKDVSSSINGLLLYRFNNSMLPLDGMPK